MKHNMESKEEQTSMVHASSVDAMEKIETAADEFFRLRAQSAHVNERLRNLATILHLATVVIGPSAERSELVLHGLTGAKRICDGLIAVTD
jgi:hypothetical protein